MASGISVITKALDIKGMHIDRVEYVDDEAVMCGERYRHDHIDIQARPYKRIRQTCPVCGEKCPLYDHKAATEVAWRANSLNGVPVYIFYKPARIECPRHGVLTEYIPWADGRSHFTRGFNDETAFLALTSPKTVVSQFMGINWRTVGNCIKEAHERIEPNVSARLHGLKRICVDETSYHKGHKYITVVYDIDRNRVAWVHEGYGQEIFKLFCEALTEEERDKIEVVAGDGARWIDSCTKTYFRNARRCIDFFHVVGWTNDALDRAKNGARKAAEVEVKRLESEFKKAEEEVEKERKEIKEKLKEAQKQLKKMPARGRPSKEKAELKAYILELEKQHDELLKADDSFADAVSEEEYRAALAEKETFSKRGRHTRRQAEVLTVIAIYEQQHASPEGKAQLSDVHKKILDEKKARADELRHTKYALGMNPENLSENLRDKLKIIEASHPDVYIAYQLKEELRAILHMKCREVAEKELDKWIEKAAACGIEQFEELSSKIARHRENILNSVELQMNSSRSEATNTTIKSLIATARGFRNLGNMFALVYLRCSDLTVPLNNRYQPSKKKIEELRELQNARKKARMEKKREAIQVW